MQAVEKLTTSPAWNTVSAVMKDRLSDALASGDTQAVIRITSHIAAARVCGALFSARVMGFEVVLVSTSGRWHDPWSLSDR